MQESEEDPGGTGGEEKIMIKLYCTKSFKLKENLKKKSKNTIKACMYAIKNLHTDLWNITTSCSYPR